jgi:hypothetical protein
MALFTAITVPFTIRLLEHSEPPTPSFILLLANQRRPKKVAEEMAGQDTFVTSEAECSAAAVTATMTPPTGGAAIVASATGAAADVAPVPPLSVMASSATVEDTSQPDENDAVVTSPASAGDDAVAEEEKEESSDGWISSMVEEGELHALENDGFLPKGLWCCALGDAEPALGPDERVILLSHLQRGLGFPPSAFFLEICRHYGIQPHQLVPNSVMYIAGFQALFEGYLGIAPSLDFFKYFFYARRITVKGALATCGTLAFNLRRTRGSGTPRSQRRTP